MSQTRSPWPPAQPPAAPGPADTPPLVAPPAVWYDREPLQPSWPLPLPPRRRRLLTILTSAVVVLGLLVATIIATNPFGRDRTGVTRVPAGTTITVGPLTFTPSDARWFISEGAPARIWVSGQCQLVEPALVINPLQVLTDATQLSWRSASGQAPVLTRPVITLQIGEVSTAPREQLALGMPPVACRLSFSSELDTSFLPGEVLLSFGEVEFKPSDGVSAGDRWVYTGRSQLTSVPATLHAER